MSDIWKYVKAKPFFEDFLKGITQPANKISGKNTRGNPIEFNEHEKLLINRKLQEMVDKLKLK